MRQHLLNMNWNQRYKRLKAGLKLTNKDVAEITGHTPNSIKTVTQPNKDFPRALKLAIVVYERLTNQEPETDNKE